MEIYSPNSKSKNLFQKNRFKSEVVIEDISEDQAAPKPVFDYQSVKRPKENYVVKKAKAIKEQLIVFLELNETTG
jgi:hypothetical protein